MSDLHTLPLHRLERPLKIHSRILAADLWLVPPGCVDQPFDAPVYTLEECRILLALALPPAALQAVHLAKVSFQGELVLPADTEDLRRLYDRLRQEYLDLEKRLDGRSSGTDETRLLQVARHLSRLLDQADAQGVSLKE